MSELDNNVVGLNGHAAALDKNPEHCMRIMHGLNKLKREKVLCDVTLIAEGYCHSDCVGHWICNVSEYLYSAPSRSQSSVLAYKVTGILTVLGIGYVI